MIRRNMFYLADSKHVFFHLAVCFFKPLFSTATAKTLFSADTVKASTEREPQSADWQARNNQFSSMLFQGNTWCKLPEPNSECLMAIYWHRKIKLKMHLEIDHLMLLDWLLLRKQTWLCFCLGHSPSHAIYMYWSAHPLLDPYEPLNILSVFSVSSPSICVTHRIQGAKSGQ